MKDEDFQNLVKSLRQAGKILRGEMKPARMSWCNPFDIKEIRRKLKLSQSEFAMMIGVSVSTLQNWEQGRRKPEGPARALLTVAAAHPAMVGRVLTRAKAA